MHNRSLLIITLLLSSVVSFAQTEKYKITVSYAASLMATTDVFVFSAGGNRTVTISKGQTVAVFDHRFSAGESYSIVQTSGPRTCNLSSETRSGTITNHDIYISADCGFPPLTLMSINVSGVESGETFAFADNFGRRFSTPFSTTANLGGFPTGDVYSVTQTSGPRPCRMSQNQGTVPTSRTTVLADCRKPAGPTTPPPPATPPATTPPATRLGSPELVSRSADGKTTGTFYESLDPVIGGRGSDDGRYIAFVYSGTGLAGATGRKRQIIWRDLKTGDTRLISKGVDGSNGNGDSFAPAISEDGQSVAFESYATNLVPIDTNGVRDIFVWNARTNVTTAVSTGPGEIETNAESLEPTINGDGTIIAFSSGASNLAPGVDGINTINVFIKKVGSGAGPILVSKDPKTGKGVGGSRPSISADGTKLAFYSYSSKLDPNDNNNLWDIFVWSGSPRVKRISLTSTSGERDQGTESASRVVKPTISGDGRVVTFSTTATNVFPGDTNKMQDAFVADANGGMVVPLSVTSGGYGNGDSPVEQGGRIAISHTGEQIVFTTNATNLGGNIVMQDISGLNAQPQREGTAQSEAAVQTLRVISNENAIGTPAISPGGRCVVFGSSGKLDKRFPSSGIFVRCLER